MTHLLPPNLLRFFVPPPPLPGLPTTSDEINPLAPPNSIRRSKGRKEIPPLSGVAPYLERVKQEAADKGEATEEGDTGFETQIKKAAKPTNKVNGKATKEEVNGHADADAMDEDVKKDDDREDGEDEEGQADSQRFTYAEQTKRELRRELKKKQHEERRERGLKEYNPKKDPEAVGDPFKTLFLARLPYSTTEKDLHREFDQYGAIERIRLIQDKEGKSRGYAFVVYEKERDMRTAYKDADGLKLQGRRILVDVERGRTVDDWKPTRLGGGLGGVSRKKKATAVAPELGMGFGPPGGFAPRGGGFRGGFGGRGGFAPRGGFGGPPRGGAPGGFGAPSGPRGGGGGFRGGYGGGAGFQPGSQDRGYGDRPAKRGRF